MLPRLILSLCDLTGNWPAPYREAGYDVRSVDLAKGEDVRLMEWPGRVHGILAAPPCTMFAASGARWVRTKSEMLEALSVVDACLRLVTVCRPAWWVLENPVGKLRRYLGPPLMTFNPNEFGDPYTKRTLLWGNFCPPVAGSLFTSTRPVAATLGSYMHAAFGGKSDRTKRARSATPLGFARAFFEANP